MAGRRAWWQQRTKRQQLLLLLGGGVVCVALVYGIALQPLQRGVAALRRQVREQEERLVKAIAATRQADEVNRAFAAYAVYTQPSAAADVERTNVQSDVEAIANDTGIARILLKQVGANAGAADRVSVRLEGEASSEELVRFLDRVQRSPRLLKITELDVRISAEGTLRTTIVITKLLLQ